MEKDVNRMTDCMDKRTAINLLDNLIGMVDDSQENDYDTALKIGIEALKADAQPVTPNKDRKLYCTSCGCNPYDDIGNYIKNHITVAEDIIATIEIDGRITNELFMVEFEDDLDFVWKSDWWEGEKDVNLIDFFPVSEAVRDKE